MDQIAIKTKYTNAPLLRVKKKKIRKQNQDKKFAVKEYDACWISNEKKICYLR